MKVFISWSGERGKKVAVALRDWLPAVIQSVEPWMSEKDLEAGVRWNEEIAAQLEQSNFGIIVVTPESRDRPWPNFEAGALAKAVSTARVVPFLVGMRIADLTQPLGMFNAVEADEGGARKLVNSVNSASKEKQLTAAMLDRVFPPQWPHLQNEIDAALKIGTPKKPVARAERDILEEILVHVRASAFDRELRAATVGRVPLRTRSGKVVWLDARDLVGVNYMSGPGGVRHYMIRNDDGSEEAATFDPVNALAVEMGLVFHPDDPRVPAGIRFEKLPVPPPTLSGGIKDEKQPEPQPKVGG